MRKILLILLLLFTLISNGQGIYVNNKLISPLKSSSITIGKNSALTTMTYGIVKSSNIIKYPKANSQNIINVGDTIIFKFGKVPYNNIKELWMFQSIYSIKDFTIVKLKSKKNQRELKIGEFSIWSGANIGVSNTSNIKLTLLSTDQNSDSFILEDAKPGEYGFIFTYNSLGVYDYIFDFSIK